MPHKKSKKKYEEKVREWNQRKFIRGILFSSSLVDRVLAEEINLLSNQSLMDTLHQHFPNPLSSLVKYERGEVLVDSKGRGTIQVER